MKLATVVEGYLKVRFVGEDATPFRRLLHFTLETYLIMPIVKQGGIKYHFLSLWYDSNWDWTPVSWAINLAATTSKMCYKQEFDFFFNGISTKVKCCWVTDCSATRIQSSSITGCHPQQTGNLIVGEGYPSAEMQSTAPTDTIVYMRDFFP